MRKTSILTLVAALAAAAVAVPTFPRTAAAARGGARHHAAARVRGLADEAPVGLYDVESPRRVYVPYDTGATASRGLYDSAGGGGGLYDSAGGGLYDSAGGGAGGGIYDSAGGGLYDDASGGVGGGLYASVPNRRALPFDNSPPATGGGSYGYNVDNLLNR